MDEYPRGSLDHSIPFLLTFGTRVPEPDDSSALSHALKDEAILIRSDLDPVDSEQSRALLRYIQERDASTLPCSARDSVPRRYRFRVKSAERVRVPSTSSSSFLTRMRTSQSSFLLAVPVFPRATNLSLRLRPNPSSCTLLTLH